MRRVALPDALRARILRAARDADPNECCGLVEGVRETEVFRITALHPARNLAASPDRFDIDPLDQFAAHKAARANGHAVIGCYHSHPGGRAEPSATDLAGAGEEDFLWLIAAGDRIAAFIHAESRFVPAELAGGGKAPL